MDYNFKGKYDSSQSYIKKDVVSYQASESQPIKFYMCLTDHSTIQKPSTVGDTVYWGMLNVQSNFPNSVDSFIYRSNVQTSDQVDMARIEVLKGKASLTVEEQNELNVLMTKHRNKFFLAEDANALQQSVSNLQLFFKDKVDGQLNQYNNEVDLKKNEALASIEKKKENIIEYMDGATAGQIRNDLGVMGELTTTDKTNLVNAINEVNAKEVDLTPINNQLSDISKDIGVKSELTTTEKSNLVNAINEVNAKEVDLSPFATKSVLNSHTSNNLLHKQGLGIVQTGDNSNAEGRNTTASGIASHAEGYKSKAIGYASHAEGGSTSANKDYSHAEGFNTNTNGINSHAEGAFTSANGDSSHAEGEATLAQGLISHAEGYESVSAGKFSHAGGYGTIATPYASRAIGRYNKAMTGDSVNFDKTSDAYVIGNGLTTDARSNAFRVTFEGKVYGMAAFNSTGADYAEYFEWADGNSELEERQGYFVTLEDDKIRKATSSDDYILGIVSVNPSVIGDSHQDDWNDKYMTDEWGRIQYHYVDVPEEKDSEGRVIQKARQDYVPILNPNWNHNEEYIPREQRKEWSPVGIVGKLLVRDDGTCEVNGFCKSNDEGIATSSTDGYRVMKRVSENIVQVFIK